MTLTHFKSALLFFAFTITVFADIQIGTSLPLLEQWSLIYAIEPQVFAEFNFVYAQLPRVTMAVIVGAMLGLVGSLMQQLTQNSLTSPLTLGTSSGAWLALIIVNVWFPSFAADHMAFAAMAGAILAMGLVITIAGPKNVTGLPLILSGMTVNILFAAIATAIILLNDQYAKNIFIWGAGDLAQNGWEMVHWLLPRICISLPILVLAPRILTLLRLGQQGAKARGLNVMPIFILLIVLGLWGVAASITAVGVISFIGLLSPNIARALGARTAREELYSSMVIGSLSLMLTDILAQLISQVTVEMLPSGTATAAIGAPALVWLSRRAVQAQDHLSIKLPASKPRLSNTAIPLLLGATALMLIISATVTQSEQGILWAIPDSFSWSIRWPRFVTAVTAGIALATAGTVLQRLIYNPLASPDILGISAGATFALVAASVFWGANIFSSGPAIAFSGSMLVLALLLLLGRKNQFSPASMIMTGIAVSASIESLVQFSLAKGTQDSYTIISWLAGSTYRVSANAALTLAFSVILIFCLMLSVSRWLTLLSVGRQFAAARGLNVKACTVILLCAVALLCALVTTTMGPVAFVGLLAPHIAAMLGAKQAHTQLIVAALCGGLLMLMADWLGQILLFPMQIAAGTLVSIIGGGYFLILLIRGQKS